jgi:meso-butanediol dehydrogenase / (S,S)-butanediol dehydrogenase / diacetyl reductase
MRLRDMVAVVTGGGTGLGRAIAELFAREGARVVVSGRRREPLEEVVLAIEKDGGRAIAVPADVTSAPAVAAVADAAVAAYGRIDVLVSNAGAVLTRTPVGATTDADWIGTLDVNLRGPYLCATSMLPELVRSRGSIVHVASVFAAVGMPNSAAYTAAKGGLVSLTRAMAIDLGAQGVRVNAVCPAYVETDMNRAMLDGLRRDGELDTVLRRIPLNRLGEPEDVAYAALYLAGPEARWVTGVALAVDGGMSAGRV